MFADEHGVLMMKDSVAMAGRSESHAAGIELPKPSLDHKMLKLGYGVQSLINASRW